MPALNTTRKREAFARLAARLPQIDHSTLHRLITLSNRLSRWAERECGDGSNWHIERDAESDIPYNVNHVTGSRYRIPDIEKHSIDEIDAIVRQCGLDWYHQTDPRGFAVYIIRPGDVPEGKPVDPFYTNGVAVHL